MMEPKKKQYMNYLESLNLQFKNSPYDRLLEYDIILKQQSIKIEYGKIGELKSEIKILNVLIKNRKDLKNESKYPFKN